MRRTLTAWSSSLWLSHAPKLSRAPEHAPLRNRRHFRRTSQTRALAATVQQTAPKETSSRKKAPKHRQRPLQRFQGIRPSCVPPFLVSRRANLPRSQDRRWLQYLQGGRARHLYHRRRSPSHPIPPHSVLNPSSPDTPLCPFDCQCCQSPMFTPNFLLTPIPTGF